MSKKESAQLFVELLEIVEKLRAPNGCPWDIKQTNRSLIPYFIEEVYEVIEGIENDDMNLLKEELGDVLLHIVFQASIADNNKYFTIKDSLNYINKKLVNRHPNVFEEKNQNNRINIKRDWELGKQKEKKRDSRLDGVPNALPALIRAQRLQEKASSSGFDWEKIEEVWEKIGEELDELKQAEIEGDFENIEEEIGDLIFSIVNLARFMDLSAESALRKTNSKFIMRFKKIEDTLKKRGKNLEDSNLQEMNRIWDKFKKSNINKIN